MKNKSVEYYSLPLTQKEFEELSRDEILKKRIEYLKENNLLKRNAMVFSTAFYNVLTLFILTSLTFMKLNIMKN